MDCGSKRELVADTQRRNVLREASLVSEVERNPDELAGVEGPQHFEPSTDVGAPVRLTEVVLLRPRSRCRVRGQGGLRGQLKDVLPCPVQHTARAQIQIAEATSRRNQKAQTDRLEEGSALVGKVLAEDECVRNIHEDDEALPQTEAPREVTRELRVHELEALIGDRAIGDLELHRVPGEVQVNLEAEPQVALPIGVAHCEPIGRELRGSKLVQIELRKRLRRNARREAETTHDDHQDDNPSPAGPRRALFHPSLLGPPERTRALTRTSAPWYHFWSLIKSAKPGRSSTSWAL